MKRLLYPAITVAIILASAFTFITSQSWNIAGNYNVKFTCGHATGQLAGLTGTISFDPANLAQSAFDVSIDVTTVNTGNGTQNNHIKNREWLNAEKYPVIKFTSTQITQSANGYAAKGILELHGVKKEIILPFTFSNNIFTGSFTINRVDFDINPSDNDDEKEVSIAISVPVSKA